MRGGGGGKIHLPLPTFQKNFAPDRGVLPILVEGGQHQLLFRHLFWQFEAGFMLFSGTYNLFCCLYLELRIHVLL